MTISFHCQSCKKKIKAQDNAGGKWGKCPHCNLKCYVPLPPPTEEEELKLIPIEDEGYKDYEEKMRETENLTFDILHETMLEDENSPITEYTPADEKKLWKKIIVYLRQMADGELDEAGSTTKGIARYGSHAKDIIIKMSQAELPEPELADIAPVVLKGLMKNLLSDLEGEND